jgi:uncharacterized membrane protein
MTEQDEDRILRIWTPIILRVSVLASAVLLVIGLVMMALVTPGFYVAQFHEIQTQGRLAIKQDWATVARLALEGHPHAILTMGLLVLTLVPLGRVGFTFVLFLKEKDWPFTALTASVLLLLMVGILLGRVG